MPLNPAAQALLKGYGKDGYVKELLSYGGILQSRKWRGIFFQKPSKLEIISADAERVKLLRRYRLSHLPLPLCSSYRETTGSNGGVWMMFFPLVRHVLPIRERYDAMSWCSGWGYSTHSFVDEWKEFWFLKKVFLSVLHQAEIQWGCAGLPWQMPLTNCITHKRGVEVVHLWGSCLPITALFNWNTVCHTVKLRNWVNSVKV